MSAPAPPVQEPVVVVGAGLGGLRVVEELRRQGFAGALMLVGAELEHPYDRPPLSKQVLRGEHDGVPLLRTVADYTELELDLRLGVRVESVDTVERTLRLSGGDTVGYGTLVLAPGAEPRTLPGTPSRTGLHLLRTHQDAVTLRAAILDSGALTVLGGGFLGCEVAASARLLGAEVTLLEQLAAPLARALGPAMSNAVQQLHVRHGVQLRCDTTVTRVIGTERVEGLELSDGSTLPTVTVLVGLGVRPETAWLSGSVALLADGAIGCDRYGRTSAESVWALGDAAAWTDATGRQRRVEHWMSAVEQAATVATNLLGGQLLAHTGVPYFWSDQYDSSLQAFGEVAPQTEAWSEQRGGGLVALHAENQTLLGVVLLDAPRLAGRARKLLRGGATVQQARETLQG